ncbi:MAG: IS21 family transposase [Candidatus Bipolaricaulia bacterium]
MLRMDQVHVIRYKVLQEGKSIRSVAREMGFSRNTIRKYLRVSAPVRRESGPRRRPVMEEVAPRIDQLLEEWKSQTTAKQRITGTRIHRQLVEEGHQVGITTVRTYLWEKRREESEVFIPLVWRPGDGAQVDFFEVTVDRAGVLSKVWKFVMRLMYSGQDFVWLYEDADQLSFLDAHVRAFEHFQAVPARVIYDNLSVAVRRMVGGERKLTDRFRALASHYLFEPCFARPGEGHDKGGVEARGKGLRLAHLTPIPRGETLEQISRQLLDRVKQSATERVDRSGRSVAQRFAAEKKQLRPLPPTPFEARRLELLSAGRKCLLRIEGADYSVPSHWKQLEVEARVGVEDIRLCCRGERRVVKRKPKGTRHVRYRHYLPELAKKPQAVRQVAPELVAELGPPYGQLWQMLSDTHGARKGARVLAGVISAIVRLGEEPVREAVQAALEAGHCDRLRLIKRLYPRRLTRVAIPEKLRGYPIQTAAAGDYDWMLKGGGR